MAGLVTLTVLTDETVLGWVAVVIAAVVNLPQMLPAITEPGRLLGVSVPTYLLMAAASACWLAYGFLTGLLLISAPHLLLLPSALITAVMAWRSQRHHERGDR